MNTLDLAGRSAPTEAYGSERRRALAALEGITDGVCLVGRDWRVRYLAGAIEPLLREVPGGAPGRGLWDVFPVLRGTDFEAHCRRAMEGRSRERCTVSLRGAVRWFDVRAQPWEDGLALFFQEVTEHRQADAALRDSEARFRSLFMHAPIGIAMGDLTGAIRAANPALQRMLGRTEEELRTSGVPAFTHPEDLAGDAALFGELQAGRRDEYRLEKRYLRSDGETIWGALTVTLARDPQGDSTSALALVEDISEGVRARRALAESEARYRLMVEESQEVFFYTHDSEHRFSYLSPSVQSVLGYAPEALIGRPYDVLLAGGAQDEQVHARTEDCLRSGARTDAYIAITRHRDGREVALELTESPVLRDGAVVGVQGFARDVTERIRAEDTLRESETRFRQLAESIREVFWLAEPGRPGLLYMSPAFEEIFGRPREVVLENRTGWLECVHPDDRPRVTAGVPDQQQGRWAAEFRIVRPDGSVRWLSTRTFPVRGADGEVYRVAGIAEDITERREAELRLRHNEQRFRALIENAPAVMMVLNADGTIRFGSPSGERLLGYAPKELLGHRLATLLHPDDVAATREAIARAVREPGSLVTAQARVLHADGSWRVFEGVGRSHLGDPAVRGIIINASDITARVEAEAALRRSEARFAGIIDLASEAIISVDAEHRIVLFNQSAESTFGYRADEVLGRPLELLLPEPFVAGWRAGDAAASARTRVPARRKDGAEFPAEASISRLDLGDETLLTVVLRDLTERERTEARLREAYDQQAAFLDNLPDVAWLRDADGRFVAVSQAFSRGVGRSAAEVVGRTVHEVFPVEAADRFHADDQAALRQGQRTTVEELVRLADGSDRWYETTRAPIRDAEGGIAGIVGIAHEISERRRMEQELRAMYDRLQQILAASSSVLYSLRLSSAGETRSTWVSANIRDVMGYRDEEALQPDWWFDRVHPDDRASACGWMDELVREGRVRHEYRFRRGDGAYRWVRDDLALTGRDGSGEIEVVGTWTDITERKEAELAVAGARDYYHALLDGLPALVWRSDAQCACAYVNSRWVEYTGRPMDQQLGDGWRSSVHPEDLEPSARIIAEAFTAREPFQVEFRLRRHDGRYRWVLNVGHPLFDAEGGFQGYIGGVIEVHNQRELEEQLRQAQKMEAVGQLAGGIAHDFNNLLTAIKGNAALLLEDLPASDPIREDVGEIAAAADRAAGLTHQLLAFSRKQVLQPRVLDLNEVIRGMSRMLRRLIGEDIGLETELGAAGNVKADRGQLEQVILNLALNARDAMPDGGRLGFRAYTLAVDAERRPQPYVEPGRYVALSVQDTGRGMDEATRVRVFEPFFTTRPVGAGTGLGLATVYGIVKQSGGYIWVESEPGRGTTFTLLLPVEDGAAAALGDGAPAAAIRGRETVLLVEDEAHVRSTARRMLQRSGYTVLEAASADQAVRLAGQHPGRIDLLLTDVVMPEVGGRELADRILAMRPETRVVFMTGYTEGSIVHRGVLDPGTILLEKPFSPQELSATVRRALEVPAVR